MLSAGSARPRRNARRTTTLELFPLPTSEAGRVLTCVAFAADSLMQAEPYALVLVALRRGPIIFWTNIPLPRLRVIKTRSDRLFVCGGYGALGGPTVRQFLAAPAFLFGIALLASSSAPHAHAGEAGKEALKKLRLMWSVPLVPPPEYDHPYRGVLTVFRPSYGEIAKRCLASKSSWLRSPLRRWL